MKILTIKTPEALDARLAAAARRRGESKSAVARAAITAYLDAEGEAASGSCLDLAEDLAGRFVLPKDLSTNPAHLRGFGR